MVRIRYQCVPQAELYKLYRKKDKPRERERETTRGPLHVTYWFVVWGVHIDTETCKGYKIEAAPLPLPDTWEDRESARRERAREREKD